MKKEYFITACSRQGVRNVLSKLNESTIVISICDPDRLPIFDNGERLPHVCDILQLRFWDEVEDRYGCISTNDASLIAGFVTMYLPFVSNIVVNCEGGVSRSAGVAAAIAKFLNDDDSAFFNPRSGRYVPNMTCYKRVLEALWFFRQKAEEKDKASYFVPFKE